MPPGETKIKFPSFFKLPFTFCKAFTIPLILTPSLTSATNVSIVPFLSSNVKSLPVPDWDCIR